MYYCNKDIKLLIRLDCARDANKPNHKVKANPSLTDIGVPNIRLATTYIEYNNLYNRLQ